MKGIEELNKGIAVDICGQGIYIYHIYVILRGARVRHQGDHGPAGPTGYGPV